ncbi:MAG: hypothetical protein AB1767_06825 [Bacillota bacterium]
MLFKNFRLPLLMLIVPAVLFFCTARNGFAAEGELFLTILHTNDEHAGERERQFPAALAGRRYVASPQKNQEFAPRHG